jgi:hypothetical protein
MAALAAGAKHRLDIARKFDRRGRSRRDFRGSSQAAEKQRQ